MLESVRVRILPLTYTQLLTYLEAKDMLEGELGLTPTGRTISENVKEMVESFTLVKMKDASYNDYLYHTFWIVVDKITNSIVAELGFKGPPDHYGYVEIGYGTMPQQQRKGFMTEAVSLLTKWAFGRRGIKGVIAEVDEFNTASLRVVEKNGFKQYEKRGRMLWWKKTIVSKNDVRLRY
ncbi:MAG: GNAT family N-acetyltransferase [Chitinophagaceae bacterium]